jgi:hypothetical protein
VIWNPLVTMLRTVLRSGNAIAGSAATCALAMGMTLAALAGCSGNGAPASGADPNLAMLTAIYVDHMNAHQGNPPQNEAAFKDYIRQHGAHRLKGADMNVLDALFDSTRDHQPLVFIYGINTDPRRQSAVIGYEQSPVDGTRTVGYRHGTVELVDDARFTELAPGPAAAKR